MRDARFFIFRAIRDKARRGIKSGGMRLRTQFHHVMTVDFCNLEHRCKQGTTHTLPSPGRQHGHSANVASGNRRAQPMGIWSSALAKKCTEPTSSASHSSDSGTPCSSMNTARRMSRRPAASWAQFVSWMVKDAMSKLPQR